MFNSRYTAVQLMGSGMAPSKAALFSIKPIINFYPDFNGAVIAVNTKGEHGKLQCTQFVNSSAYTLQIFVFSNKYWYFTWYSEH